MSKIVDLFGIDIAASRGIDWRRLIDDQRCPFVEKRCYKVRKSQPDVSIGTCTVGHGRDSVPIMICPNRFLERQQIFVDCLHLLEGHLPGNELHVVPEVGVPGGIIDFFLVSALDGRVRDFVGIEIQALDTIGTVWPERQRLLRRLGFKVKDARASSNQSYGINWKMTAKTILVQLHHKVRTFEHLNKHLTLVVQDRFLDYMSREFRFEHLHMARNADPMHFHSYRLVRRPKGHQVALSERHSTDTEGIALCLGLQAEANVDLAHIVTDIEAKISEATLFRLSDDAGSGHRHPSPQ